MYIVIELQTNEETATIVNAYEDKELAEQRYHSILAAAAVSAVRIHAAVMLSAEGYYIKSEYYTHKVEE